MLATYYPRNKSKLVFWLVLALCVIFVDTRTPLLKPAGAIILQALTPFGWGQQTVNEVTKTLLLRSRTTQSLLDENAFLKEDALETEASLQEMDALEDENAKLRALLKAKNRMNTEGHLAFVKQNTLASFSHQILLKEGTAQGILPGQAVIDEEGVVGLIVSATKNEATVLLITDPNHGLPVKNARTKVRMIARGTAHLDRLVLSHLAETIDVKPGDTILTSGVGGHFPEGYPVGVVISVKHNTSDSFVTVLVEPFSHLADLNMVFVLEDKH